MAKNQVNFNIYLYVCLLGLFFFGGKAFALTSTSEFFPYGGNISKELAFVFAKEEAKHKLAEELVQEKMFQQFLFASEMEINDLTALIFLNLEVEFQEEIKEEDTTLLVQAKGELKNQEAIFPIIQEKLAFPKRLNREIALYEEYKKIMAESKNILAEGDWIRKNIGIDFDKGYSSQLKTLENSLGIFTQIVAALSHYNGLWQNLPEIQGLFEEGFTLYPDILFIRSTLAEIYLQTDRPQAALALLDSLSAQDIDDFTFYIRALIQVRLGHYALAGEDVERGFEKMSSNDIYISDFLVLRGLIHQFNNNVIAMCDDYALACTYNNCEAYYHAQKICLE